MLCFNREIREIIMTMFIMREMMTKTNVNKHALGKSRMKIHNFATCSLLFILLLSAMHFTKCTVMNKMFHQVIQQILLLLSLTMHTWKYIISFILIICMKFVHCFSKIIVVSQIGRQYNVMKYINECNILPKPQCIFFRIKWNKLCNTFCRF